MYKVCEEKADVTQFYQDINAYRNWFSLETGLDIEETGTTNIAMMVKAAIQYELTDTQRKYFTAYYLEEKSENIICKMYGVNKSTVSRSLKRGRSKLERVLKYSNPRYIRIWEDKRSDDKADRCT